MAHPYSISFKFEFDGRLLKLKIVVVLQNMMWTQGWKMDLILAKLLCSTNDGGPLDLGFMARIDV